MRENKMPDNMDEMLICTEIPMSMMNRTDNLQQRPLAMAYVEWQKWQKVYPAEVGFSRGTLFEELDLPFIGEEVVCDD